MASALVSRTPCSETESNIVNVGKPVSPFKCLDTEIYLYRDIECVEKEKVRSSQQNLKVFEKTTISSRARSRKTFRRLEEAIERETQGDIEKDTPALNWALAFAKCCQSDKQSIADYISEQKELFLLEYAVKIKQRTISKMEKMAAKEERKAKIAEMKLEEDTLAFEEFLRENDKSSVDALKLATQEAKAKMEVMAEVKSAMNEVFSLKDKWAHVKGQQPVKGLPTSQKPVTGRSASVIVPHHEEKKKSLQTPGGDYSFFRKSSRGGLSHRTSLEEKKYASESERSMSLSSEEDFSLEDIQSDEEPEIYFKDPQELLQMFRHLEEQNLSLFQNIQEISGTLEDSQQKDQAIQQQMEQRIKSLVEEKEALKAACTKEEAKSAELALKAKLFSTGDYNAASMDKMLNTLTKKVAEVYKVCCGADEVSSLTPFQMLKVIEIRVSELCEMLETLPKEYLEAVEANEKLRAKERRQRVREDKLKELKRIQEQRVIQALERAIAAPKKRVGRKLMYRSQPPKPSQGQESVTDSTTKSEDDYYFT